MKKIAALINVLKERKICKKEVYIGEDFLVDAIVCDSRQARKDSIFVCIAGFLDDGHNYIDEAIKRGARAIVMEKERPLPAGIIGISVPSSRQALGILAREFYERPDENLKIIGVTGTNGKTTTTYLIRAILKEAGRKTGLLGTINYEIRDTQPAQRTTPDALSLFSLLAEAKNEGMEYVVMEVSSHSLCLNRVEEIEFNQAIFTNLNHEHLDFHSTMEEYLKAKKRLFYLLDRSKKNDKSAIINVDDSYAQEFLKEIKSGIITYGMDKEALVSGGNLTQEKEGISFTAHTPDGPLCLHLRLSGFFNAYNALAAIAASLAQKIPPEVIKAGLERQANIPGRFERIDAPEGYVVLVDYAHTPQALDNLIKGARMLSRGKVITVFGCGGDRDRSKRPLMGKVVASLSDYAILTSDNPRSEDPARIILDVEVGIQKTAKDKESSVAIIDRRQAIEKACAMARSGDIVIVAGKGHEKYQIIGQNIIPFDDKEVVREIIGVK